MDTVTLVRSTMRGSVAGKTINCTVHTAPAGLKLPAGQYLLRPAEDNPVYGLVMSIEPMRPGDLGPSAIKAEAPGTQQPSKMAPSIKVDSPGAPSAIHKSPPPAGLKMSPAGLKMAPAGLKMAPAGLKMAPASKVDSPGAPSAIHKSPPPAGLKTAPSPAAMRLGPIVVSDRSIAGNCLVVTSGFGDLVDAVQRAGGVTLIVT